MFREAGFCIALGEMDELYGSLRVVLVVLNSCPVLVVVAEIGW